jgi:hypothetical protein
VDLEISRRWDILLYSTIVTITILFWLFSDQAHGKLVAFVFIAIACAVRVRWDLRRRISFWILMAIWTVLHLTAIFRMHWKFDIHPGALLIPLGIIDFCAVTYSTKLIDVISKIYDKKS